MIEVYQRDHKGHLKSLGIYTEEEFASFYGHDVDSDFSTCDADCTVGSVLLRSLNVYIEGREYKKVAYNEKGKVLPVDHLIGITRAYHRNRIINWRARWKKKYDCGYKKPAYGWLRRIHTTKEKRWAHAWDDEEFAPKKGFARGRRSAHNLPDSWDDYWAQAQKSWKWQSKRKRQWKHK